MDPRALADTRTNLGTFDRTGDGRLMALAITLKIKFKGRRRAYRPISIQGQKGIGAGP